MKHIVRFSLERRFKNKVTIILHVLIVTIVSALMFMDKIVEFVFQDATDKVIIYYDPSIKDIFLNAEDDFFILKEGYNNKEINIVYEDKWIIESTYNIDPVVSVSLHAFINKMVSSRWLATLNDESVYEIIIRTTFSETLGIE